MQARRIAASPPTLPVVSGKSVRIQVNLIYINKFKILAVYDVYRYDVLQISDVFCVS